MTIKHHTLVIILSLVLSSCLSFDFSKRIIQQGNVLNPKSIAKLKPGMSKEKVAKIMGSSIIAPLFNSDRWDYAYTYRKGNVESKQMNISIFFAHDQLIRVDQNI